MLLADEAQLAALGGDGRTARHWLCAEPAALQRTAEGAHTLFDAVCTSIYFPRATVLQDASGDTPLHLLCRNPACTEDTLRLFLRQTERPLLTPNHAGRLPLHYLAGRAAPSAEVNKRGRTVIRHCYVSLL